MPSEDATPTLVAELDRATRAHPHDHKVLVSGRPAEGRELLRVLALTGRPWIGWEPLSLRQLAGAVVGIDMARAGLGTADGFDVMALVDDAIDAAERAGETGPFGGPVPGAYRDPIRRTVEALRLAGVEGTGLAAVAGGDAKLRMLGAILTAYEKGLAGRDLLDGPGILARAASALAGAAADGGRAGTASSIGSARIYLLPGLVLRGVEGRLIRTLLDGGATVLATDPVRGLDGPPGRLWAQTSGPAGPLSRLHDTGVARHGDGPGPAPEIDLFAAATPADEIREVLRRVVATGVPWDRVEIVATDTATYGPALDGLARRLGIPVTHADGLPLSRTRVGRATAAYFRWIADGYPVDPIRRLLESGDLTPPAGTDAPSPAALARRLRRLRIGWGHGRYLPVLDRAVAAAERTAPPRDDDDEEAGRLARERELGELRALRALLAPILAATPHPASRHAAWTGTTSPARLAEGLRSLLERVPAGDEVENTARGVLVERLERARATLTRETGWLAATAMLRSRLETRIAATSDAGRLSPWTSTGGHLHLSDVSMGGLAARPYTFVVGLASGAVGAGGADPLLTDADRGRLNRGAGSETPGQAPLPTTAERLDESRHALAAMLARLRGHITLSYAAWDTAEGRTVGPAPELLQALRLRDGDASLTYESLRERLGRLACAVPAPGATGGLLDGADVWLGALATTDGMLRDGRVAVRALHAGLDRGLDALDTRQGHRLTAHHGVVPADPELDPLRGDGVLSASRLETLGKCPLRYFYRYVLGVRPVRDPTYDPAQWLDALERGSLLHDVYERTLAERPADMDYAGPSFAEHALRILDEEVRRTLLRLPVPNDAVLRSERDVLDADVRSFVIMIREQRPDVVRTELAFGPDPDSDGAVQLDLGGRAGEGGGRLRLRGRVDRVDALAGRALRIVDYKTGAARGHRPDDPFDGGRRLQHFLYTLAVEHLRPGDRVDVAEYHFPTTRGENRVAPYTRAALERGHEVLASLIGLAREGRFLATDDTQDCRFCDFASICRVRVGGWGGAISPRAAWARTTGAGLEEYGPLIRLRGGEGAGAGAGAGS